jgi:hypothetical protein
MGSHQWLAGQLHDLRCWVEARALLLWEECAILALQEEPELAAPFAILSLKINGSSESRIRVPSW